MHREIVKAGPDTGCRIPPARKAVDIFLGNSYTFVQYMVNLFNSKVRHYVHLQTLINNKRQQGKTAVIAPYCAAESVIMPFFESTVPAGFPSPADDYLDKELDLNDLIVRHPAATFFVRVAGESMIGAGIHSGDILVVDRAEEPVDNKIVVAVVNGEFTVKRIRKVRGKLWLEAENPALPALAIAPEMQFEVWGVVTYVLHQVQ